MIWIGLGLFAGVIVAAFLFFAFLLTGGFDRLRAENETARRGYTATEAQAAPGFLRLSIPKSWKRDTYREYLEDSMAERTPTGTPRTVVHMGGPSEAALNFVLGQFSHAGGTSDSGTLTLYARAQGAAPWTPEEGANGLIPPMAAQLERVGTQDGIEIYRRVGDTAPQVTWRVLNDPAKGLRLLIVTRPPTYSEAETIALGLSVLNSAEIDHPAVTAAREADQRKRAAIRESGLATLRRLEADLGRMEPLTEGLNTLAPGSFAWLQDMSLEVFVRFDVLDAGGQTPMERAAALNPDLARLAALSEAHPEAVARAYKPIDLIAVWPEGDVVKMWGLRSGLIEGELKSDHPLRAAIAEALPPGAIGIYRYRRFYLPSPDNMTPWFGLNAAIVDAAKTGPALWR